MITELYIHWNKHFRCEAYHDISWSIDQHHFNLINVRTNQKLSDAHAHLRLVFFSETHMSARS